MSEENNSNAPKPEQPAQPRVQSITQRQKSQSIEQPSPQQSAPQQAQKPPAQNPATQQPATQPQAQNPVQPQAQPQTQQPPQQPQVQNPAPQQQPQAAAPAQPQMQTPQQPAHSPMGQPAGQGQPPMQGQGMPTGQMAGQPTTGEVKYAGFWIRFVASFIDGLLLFVITIVILISTVGFSMPNMEQVETGAYQSEGNALTDLLSILLSLGYYVLTTGSNMQATLGKKAVGIKVIREDGSRITYLRALGRWFAYILSYLTLWIGFIMAGFTKQKTALHDLVAGTRVIYSR